MSSPNTWQIHAELEVARLVLVLVELADKTNRDWRDRDDLATLLPAAIQISLAVTKKVG